MNEKMTYYCPKCKEFVIPIVGSFLHPHEGLRTCYICPKCQHMVYVKKAGGELEYA